MDFKTLLQQDAKAFVNVEEFGITISYNGAEISSIYDVLKDEAIEGLITSVSVVSVDVANIAKNDIFTIHSLEYRVVDFVHLDGITDVILNRRQS